MAAILVLFGSSAGFFAAMAHVALFGGSILTGLAMWTGLGTLCLVIAVLLVLFPTGQRHRIGPAQEA